MRFGSVCSGIEAASCAWSVLGWTAAWFSEIEPFPCAVLKSHYPNIPNYGDMTKLPERILSGEIEAPDIVCGGTPCQGFSVAGLNGSLDDPRGQLTLKFCEIVDAIDTVRLRLGKSPCIVFWENVDGVLSTKDNAFGCFLGKLGGDTQAIEPGPKPAIGKGSRFWRWKKSWTEEGVIFPSLHVPKWPVAGEVIGPKRHLAWRVLNAEFFELAQRRNRVFVVGCLRDWLDPAKLLFEYEGVRRDSPPSRSKGQGITHDIAGSLTSSGRGIERAGDTRGQDPVVAVRTTVQGGELSDETDA